MLKTSTTFGRPQVSFTFLFFMCNIKLQNKKYQMCLGSLHFEERGCFNTFIDPSNAKMKNLSLSQPKWLYTRGICHYFIKPNLIKEIGGVWKGLHFKRRNASSLCFIIVKFHLKYLSPFTMTTFCSM